MKQSIRSCQLAALGAAILLCGTSLAESPLASDVASLNKAAPLESVPEKGVITLGVRRSLLLRAKADIHRTAVVDSSICEIVQTTPRELSIVGRSSGRTQVTIWFSGPEAAPLSYVVEVKAAEVMP